MNQQSAPASTEPRPTVQESCERLGAELSNLLWALAPSDEVLVHFRAARLEILKGLRAAIDARIAQVSEEGRRGTSVPIE